MFSIRRILAACLAAAVVLVMSAPNGVARERNTRQSAVAKPSDAKSIETPVAPSSDTEPVANLPFSPMPNAVTETPASGESASETLLGIPQIHRLHGVRSSSRFGGRWWFKITDTYTGTPPAESSSPVLIPSVELQGVYLGSSFASTDASTVTTLEAYLSFLAGSTDLSQLKSPYDVSSGTSIAGQVINVALPQYSDSSPTYLTDAEIVTYLTTNINNSTLTTTTSSTVYVVYVEPGVAVDAGGGSTSINSFLGYHNSAQVTLTSGTATIYYAVIPYPDSPNPTPASQGFSNATDELTAVASHEIVEAATDPDTVSGWHETVDETIALQIFGWTLFQWTTTLTGEEICDVSLLLNNYGSQCYARYGNGYLIQQPIGPEGTTMLTPSGATELSATSNSASDSDADDGFSIMGVRLW